MTLLAWRTPAVPAATLEAATLPAGADLASFQRALEAKGLVYLATCQRVTWVLHGAAGDAAARVTALYAGLGRDVPAPEAFAGFEAFRHLAEVASSLDSLVPGEPQILGQVRQAIASAEGQGLLDNGLRHALDLVLHTAKAVRSQTGLFRGKVSLLPLAQAAIEEALGGQSRPVVAVFGTGEMARRSIETLRQANPLCDLHVVTRSRPRAAALAEGATVHELEGFLADPPPVGLMVLAMDAPRPILPEAWMARHASGRPLTVIDLGMPRNAEAPSAPVPGLRIVQMDDLVRLGEEAKKRRAHEYDEAVRVLEDELDRVRQEYDARCHASALFQLGQRFQEVAERRWTDAHRHLDASDAQARKWYEQTVRALLHEAAQAIKSQGAARP